MVNLPLAGIKVIEFEGLGPGPLAGRWLADMGASVTVVARTALSATAEQLGGAGENPLRHGKTVRALNLKSPADRDLALNWIADSDALIEGFRPGVMERLGLGPAQCAERNPRLVYGRMTGWGQSGPLSQSAGHDLNYLALTGLLGLACNAQERPKAPPTVLGDAGGALGLAFGMVCALLDAQRSGQGRVVDAAIVDVVAMLGTLVHWIRGSGQIDSAEPSPFHDSPFYDAYRCADGAWVTVGALESQFYAEMLQRLGLTDVDPGAQYDRSTWPALKARLAAVLASQPRAHWCALLEGSDACFAPVLSLAEALRHPHHLARGTYITTADGGLRAAAAPRFLPLGGADAAPEQ